MVVSEGHVYFALSALSFFVANDPARWAGLLHFAPLALMG